MISAIKRVDGLENTIRDYQAQPQDNTPVIHNTEDKFKILMEKYAVYCDNTKHFNEMLQSVPDFHQNNPISYSVPFISYLKKTITDTLTPPELSIFVECLNEYHCSRP